MRNTKSGSTSRRSLHHTSTVGSKPHTNQRQGLSHISRLVELWLAAYGLEEDDSYENDFAQPAAGRRQSVPVVTGVADTTPVQSTFSFYQTTNS